MDTVEESFSNLKPFFCSIGTKVMVTTGNPSSSARKTEVVDVVTGESCADLANFPLANNGAVGANLNETPIVCGGVYSSYYQTCYKFSNGGWQEFASMKEKRSWAAGVMHKNKLHVFGGYGGNGLTSNTTELISVDGIVEYGPELPQAVWMHTITSINSTVSLLSGGITGACISFCFCLVMISFSLILKTEDFHLFFLQFGKTFSFL